MHLTWLGHSCFKIEKEGYTVIVDPYKDDSVPGLRKIRETADLVFCSHEHGDHCGRECVKIREGGKNPFQITEIPTYHDDSEGSQRGKNIIRIFDDGEARIAHFGDLGCLLTPEQEELLGGLDLVLIPVGGFYTIDGETAAEIVKRIKPKKVIPMHYRDSKRGYLDVNNYDFGSLMGVDFDMDKKQRIQTFSSMSAHAMTLVAVDLDEEGKPTKWMVENSWGASYGHQGHLIMTDRWFDEYMFRLVVETKYVPEKVLKVFRQKPIQLPAWDPMFAEEK